MNKLGTQRKDNDVFVDFSAIFGELKRYWWLFLASILVCLIGAGLYIYVSEPVYLVMSKVLISQDDDSSNGSGGMGAKLLSNLSIGGGTNVDDELIVFASHDLHAQVAKELRTNCTYIEKANLLKKIDRYKDSPIEISAIGNVLDTLKRGLKFKVSINKAGDEIKIKVKQGLFKTLNDVKADRFPVSVETQYGVFVVDTTKYYKQGESLDMTAAVFGYELKAEDYDDNLSVGLVSKKSNGISITTKETNVQRGCDVINKLVSLYNQRCQAEKDEMAVNTGKFIDERLVLIYDELSKSEADIENYKQKHGISDMSIELGTLVEKRELSENARVQLETQYSIVNMIKDFIADSKNDGSLIPFTANLSGSGNGSGSDASIEAYNALLMERLKLKNSAKENNVALKLLDEQIAAMKVNVQSNVDRALESLKIQLNDAREQESYAKGALSGLPTSEREARELYRQQGIKHTLYTYLLQKREENALVLAATTPKGKVVDSAYAHSEPISLSKFVILFIALCIGLVLPLAFIYVKRLLNTKFTTQDELENIVSVPVLGEICHNRHRSSLVVRAGKTSSIVELFRLLRNNVQFMLPNLDDKVILVTSSVSGEGKSFVSLNLASSFALLGKKVALVGMDIRSPKLHEYLGINPRPGVTTYLSKSDVVLPDIVQHLNDVENLDVIVGGPIPPNPSELLLTTRVKELIDALREEYDFVIIDSAPMAMVSDTFSLARYANAVVYVSRANYTKRHFIKYLNEVVANGQLHNVAAVLNDTNPRYSMGYGYGYGSEVE